MEKNSDVLIISCGIFKKEIEFLKKENRLSYPTIFLDSAVHIYPEKLQTVLTNAIEKALKSFQYIILMYGDCHPYINDLYDPKRVVRLSGINCCENILGRELYRKLRKEGAFFVFEEWAYRWKEIFVDEIGLNEKIAPIFMKSMHKSILYIDTGVSEVPIDILKEMSAFFDLPFDIMKVELDFLTDSIVKAYEGIC